MDGIVEINWLQTPTNDVFLPKLDESGPLTFMDGIVGIEPGERLDQLPSDISQ